MKIASDGRLAFWPEPEARRNFEHRLSPGLRREWDSLSAESDLDLIAAAALRIAGRLESSDQPEKAGFLLAALAQSSQLASDLQAKAKNRWAGLRGEGNFGVIAESLLGRLAREAQRPWPMLAMAGAGTCFQISRLALLARWRGPAANLALPLATVGEAALFTSALPLLEKISPHSHGGAWRGFGPEFLSSLLLMGGLKIGAWPLRFTAPALAFPATYGGVMLAQTAERRLGLRPEASASTAWIDGLAMALQIQAGAGLGRLALGERGMRLLGEAEIRVRRPRPAIPGSGEGLAIGIFNGAPAGVGVTGYKTRLPSNYAMMSGDDDSGAPRSRPQLRLVSSDPQAEFMQTFGTNRSFQEAYHRILSHYESRHDGNKLTGLLLSSDIHHPGVMIPGLNRLADILCSNAGETGHSYRKWLALRIYERVYFESRSPRALGEILRTLAQDESATVMEQRLAEHFPELDLRASREPSTPTTQSLNSQMTAAKRLHDWREFERNSSLLPLSDQSRWVVFDWKRTQDENYLGNMRVQIDRFLDELYELGQGPRASRVTDINAALETAGQSPLGVARLARLDALLRANRGDPSPVRLKELLENK
ncbi:MAG TPA: hypothetical protein VJR29_07875 [bacterium]|nr:hypothetical protein [bacterium]